MTDGIALFAIAIAGLLVVWFVLEQSINRSGAKLEFARGTFAFHAVMVLLLVGIGTWRSGPSPFTLVLAAGMLLYFGARNKFWRRPIPVRPIRDSVFGKIEYSPELDWSGSADFDGPEPAMLFVEGGTTGPSALQRDRFTRFRLEYPALELELRARLDPDGAEPRERDWWLSVIDLRGGDGRAETIELTFEARANGVDEYRTYELRGDLGRPEIVEVTPSAEDTK